MSNKKINIVTLGCSKNLVDSEKLMKQLESGGYEFVYDQNDTMASTVIINTCGFINDAREESIDTILRFVRARQAGSIENLYVMGCLSERYTDALRSEIPEVDNYFGVNSFREILGEMGVIFNEKLLSQRTLTGPGHYAYLKVSEGCDRTCAFCAIPLIRGKYISRSMESVVEEAKLLAERGVKELILIAQDLTYYGLDLYKSQRLPELLKRLVKIEGIEWIRLQYLYPANFPLELIQVIRENPKICRYIDIPIQHISDNMLSKMKRTHNRAHTINLLNKLRSEIPGTVIRTTLIAGYPGESKSDYKELKDFISEFKFDRLGVFAYSHEEGTSAYKDYSDDIPQKIKEARVSELMEIQQNISSGLNSTMIGKVLKVIIDRKESDFFAGRTEFDSPEVDQEVLVPSDYNLETGKFYNIEITRAEEFDLFGVPAG